MFGLSQDPLLAGIWTSCPDVSYVQSELNYEPVLLHNIVQGTICVYMATQRLAHILLAK